MSPVSPLGINPLLIDGLTRLKAVLLQLRLHAKDSPLVRQAADAFCGIVPACLDGAGKLTFEIDRNDLLVNGRVVPDGGPISSGLQTSLSALLRAAGVRSVTFHAELGPAELIDFLDILAGRFWDLRDGAEINRRLRAGRILRVVVDTTGAPPPEAPGPAEPGPRRSGETLRMMRPRGPGETATGTAIPAAVAAGSLPLGAARAAMGELARLAADSPPEVQAALRRVGKTIADAFRDTPFHASLLQALPPEPAPVLPGTTTPKPVSGGRLPSPPEPARSRLDDLLAGRDAKQAGLALRNALETEADPDLRVDLVEMLGRLRDPEAVEPLGRIVKSRSEASVVRAAACIALGQIGDPRAVATLVWAGSKGPLGMTQILKSVPPVVRAAALRALTAFRSDPAAQAVLDRGRSDPDTSIRVAANAPLTAPTPIAPRDQAWEGRSLLDIADPLEERGFPRVGESPAASPPPSPATVPAEARHDGPRPDRPEETADQERAREVQEKLIPRDLPPLAGWDAAHAYLPAGNVGGDCLDAFPLAGDRAGFVVGDVSGKGVSGAMVMVMVRSAFRNAAAGNASPAETAAAVNRLVRADIKPGMFVSVVYACLHLPTGELTLVNCGHNPPVVREGTSLRARLLGNRGLPLGVAGPDRFDASLREESIRFGAGDRILFYTDGVVEAMNARDEEFGEEAFLRVVNANALQSSRAMVDAVVAAIAAHRGTAAPSDDITLLDLRRRIA